MFMGLYLRYCEVFNFFAYIVDKDIGAGGFGFDSRPVKSDIVVTAAQFCVLLCWPRSGDRLAISYTLRRNPASIVKI